MAIIPQADIIEEILKSPKAFERNGLEEDFCIYVKNIKKKKINKKKFIIEGFAATSDKDRVNDVITNAALKEAKNHLLQDGASTVFYNHNRNRPIGKVIATEFIFNKGLKVTILISKAKDVRSIRTKLRENVLKSLSIGGRFKKVRIERDEEGRVIAYKVLRIELYEVSVVGLPANPKARITSVEGKPLKGWTKMWKNIKFKTSATNDNGRSDKVAKKKTKKKDKKEVDKDVDDNDDEQEDTFTKEVVSEMIKEAIDPISESVKEIAGSVKKLADLIPQENKNDDDDDNDNEDDDDENDEKDKKKTKKKDKDTSDAPEWAKDLAETVDSISKRMKKIENGSDNKRKGYTGSDDPDDNEDDDNEDDKDVPKKKLSEDLDEDTLKYLDYIYNKEPGKYTKLTDEEKQLADALYAAAMLIINGK